MSVSRHARIHLPARLRRAAEAAKTGSASPKTVDQITELNKLARAIFTRGYNQDNLSAALGALSELRKLVELEGRLIGELKDVGSTTNVVNVNLTRDQAAGMAEILIQRYRANTIDTTAAEQKSSGALVSSEFKENR